MKYWLILYIMAFSPGGQLVGGHWIEQPQPSAAACSQALDKVMDDWKRKIEASSWAGIVGRCSDKPLSSRET